MPGIKVGRSRAQLPLKVEVEEVAVPEGFVQTLNDHLLLVYTGKTRLARNLLQVSPRPGGGREAEAPQGPALHCTLLPHLQDVLRSWYARLPAVVQNAHSLVRHTEECVKAFRQGEVPLPRGRAPGRRGLVALGSKARGLFRLVGGRPPGTEAYHLSSLGSCFRGSRISGQYLHHEEGFQSYLPRSSWGKRLGPLTECQGDRAKQGSREWLYRSLNTAGTMSVLCPQTTL